MSQEAKKVPLVKYDEDGNRKVIGDALVTGVKIQDGNIYVEGVIHPDAETTKMLTETIRPGSFSITDPEHKI